MAEMNRSQNQQQDRGRRSDPGMGRNQDTQPSGTPRWDGNERRTGGERRSTDDRSERMEMNEGSSR
jgi:hypothetical protein